MRKSLLFCLSVFGIVASSAADGFPTNPKGVRGMLAQKEWSAGQTALLLDKSMHRHGVSLREALPVSEPSASFSAPGWGFLLGPDGTQWSYTQSYEKADGSSSYYASSTITVFNDKHEVAGEFTVDVSDVANVNQITVSGDVTNKFFDNDASTNELMVWYHTAINGVTGYKTLAYRLDGTKLFEYDGSSVFVDASENEWTTYQRVFLIKDVNEGDISGDGSTVEQSYAQVEVLSPVTWRNSEPTVEHTFKIPAANVNMMDGSFINFIVIDGAPYYIVSQYEKPYISDASLDVNTGVMEPTFAADNSFMVSVLDRNYNEVGSLKAPIEIPDDAYCRMAGIGMMSDKDVSKNFFTTDDGFAYVVRWNDYITATDANRYAFDVFDGESNKVNTVCDNVYNTYYSLAPVKGYEEQMVFMQIIDDEEQILAVDIPSCATVAVFPSEIEGEMISTDLNRVAKDGGYQYLVKLSYATSDGEGNVIARLGWYNRDLTLDRYVSFNLGPNGMNFRPGLLDNLLSPYVFNTDDDFEYIYFAKIKRDDSDIIDDCLVVANEKGEELLRFNGDDDKGALFTCMLFTEDVAQSELAVVYVNSDWTYTLDFYQLPFGKFDKGGDGTEAAPYLISTVGDLLQVNSDTDAFYKLACNIDMNGYAEYWKPLDTFSGSFDGDNHYIDGLSMDSDDSNVGLFSSLGIGAVVKNLVILNPSVDVNDDNQTVGVVAGSAMMAKLSNVHVFGGNIVAAASSWAVGVGGLVGSASNESCFSACSFNGEIDTEGCSSVGGIAGLTRTSTKIEASSASGSFSASDALGGIAGTTETDCAVLNSHSDATLKAATGTVGGIVGSSSRGLIDKCYAEGSIEVSDKPMWGGYNAGGIVGDLATDWSLFSMEDGTEVDPVVSNCVAMNSISLPELASGEIPDETSHRIIGRSMINEAWEDWETPMAEKALSGNYALNTVTVGGNIVECEDAGSTEGASVEKSGLVTAFFSGTLGYGYGSEAASPWSGDALPVLFFEDKASALTLSAVSLSLVKYETASVTISVYGTSAEAISVASADLGIAGVEVTEYGDGYVVVAVTANAEGSTVITVSADGLTAECIVAVSDLSGITVTEASVISPLTIKAGNGIVSAAGATRIAVYSVNGQAVAMANTDSVDTAALAGGVYVVIANNAEGRTAIGKIVVR